MKINITTYSNSDIMSGVYTQHHMFGYWAHGMMSISVMVVKYIRDIFNKKTISILYK